MPTQTKRIYVDSRYRMPGGTETDFKIALKTPVELERGMMGWIDGVVVPNTYRTIIEGHNDTLFVREALGSIINDRVIVVPTGDYNAYALAANIKLLLNGAGKIPALGLWDVWAGSGSFVFFNATPKNLLDGGVILPRNEIENPSFGPAWGQKINPSDPDPAPLSSERDICRVIGLIQDDLTLLNNDPLSILDCQAMSLSPYHQLFLHSHIGAPSSQGPRGENTIVRRIIVSSSSGDLITDQLSTQMDYIDLGNELSTMHFSLRDVDGKVVDTRGHPISFAICIP